MLLEFALGGGEGDEQANIPIGVNQTLIRDHLEAAIGRDEIYCRRKMWKMWKNI